MRRTLDLFHGSFARLIALEFPSVAAIHGHCLGGGLEFALACTARIAKEGKNTLIGLPECNVGLFPGGGGTQRLPRLIGYGAFELILKGTMLPAAKAYETGDRGPADSRGRRPACGGEGAPRRGHRGNGEPEAARPGFLPDRRRRRDGEGGDPQGDQGPGDPGADAGPQIDARGAEAAPGAGAGDREGQLRRGRPVEGGQGEHQHLLHQGDDGQAARR